ncbi:TRC40/GET3/ArsA family transport-energizing ATPase [Rhizobium arsenicireducens]
MNELMLLTKPNRHLFFTGKGGVGKTSISCATAIALADKGLKVLLVSTDPASNLDEMLGVALGSDPTPVPGVPGLLSMNIDPETAAEDYRARVLDQMGPAATDTEKATVREQLSGACTTEIAAFDEFVDLLADDNPQFDHIIFDTAPTGHTLRLLSLPKAWTGFLEANERGASCLGPHSGLKMQEDRFRDALECLGDPARTTIVLVTRAERGAIREAARTAGEAQRTRPLQPDARRQRPLHALRSGRHGRCGLRRRAGCGTGRTARLPRLPAARRGAAEILRHGRARGLASPLRAE